MSSPNELPAKCIECNKSTVSRLHRKCRFCNELEFEESVLCDLNQCIQVKSDFDCHAFQPMLKLVSPLKNKVPGFNDGSTREIKKNFISELLKSDKIKYEKALALQQLACDPDGVYVQLKYHIAWNISQRRTVFTPVSDFIDFVNGIFLKCSDMVRGFAYLLHLAQDHVHVYVESDGELSIEEMVRGMKRLSNNAILKKFPLIKGKLDGNTEIWDEAYFVETIG